MMKFDYFLKKIPFTLGGRVVPGFLLPIGLLCLTVFILSSCAPRSALPDVSQEAIESEAARQLAFRFENMLEQSKRVQTVGFKVLTANSDQCKKTGPVFGFSFLSLDQLPEDIRPIAQQRLAFERRPGVSAVVPESPADKAGLRTGDLVLNVAGTPVAEGKYGANKLGALLKESQPGGPVRITVSRGGKEAVMPVSPVTGCAYPVYLAGENETNAFTDGSKIVIQRGMLTIASTDEELALVIGHELAHITAGHLRKKAGNQVAGTFAGLAVDLAAAAAGVNTKGAFTRAGSDIGRRAYSQSFEKEADYIGMYFAERAGYSTAGVERFWRKMADANPNAIYFAGTHPTSAERFLIISKTHQEITAKRKAKQALLPNQATAR